MTLRFHPTEAEAVTASAPMAATPFKQAQTALRERWLSDLAALLVPVLVERAALTFPLYRVTCGFPSTGGRMGAKKRTRGECWEAAASKDRHAEIFVSPVEDDAEEVAFILSHELIHAALPKAGHRKPFANAASKIGHVPPFATGGISDAFKAFIRPYLDQLGPYPHARLNAMAPIGAPKKQSARLLKCECEDCGYTCRVTRKWIDDVGAPICPCNGEAMKVDLGDDDSGEA